MDPNRNALARLGQQTNASSLNMILVMGVTGSGKSYFVNQLAGRELLTEGHSLRSCTQKCQPVCLEIGGSKTVFVDTPGFDDTTRPAAEVLEEISKTLTVQYESGMRLRGIIYLHRITDVKYSGSAIHTFQVLRKICGDEALKNVILVTTRWPEVDRATGAMRENQLRDEFWSYMLSRGASMSRFHGTRDSAVVLASQLLSKDPVILALQQEISLGEKSLDETTAGAYVSDDLVKMKKMYEAEVEQLKSFKEELEQEKAALKDREKVLQDLQQKQERLEAIRQQEERLHEARIAQDTRMASEQNPSWSERAATVNPIFSLLASILSITGIILN